MINYRIRSIRMLFVILMTLAAGAQMAHAAKGGRSDFYQKYMSRPSEELIRIGKDYRLRKNKPDSALLFFTIVAGRYTPNMSAEEKREVVEALNMNYFIYSFTYLNYPKAYENLLRAHTISKELGETSAALYFNLGSMYQLVAGQGRQWKLYSKALDCYRKGVRLALAKKDMTTFNTLLGRYRIREACRRFNDPQRYGSYTIESIARDLGFKSRSNFATTFKKHTGLNPSEYLRLAKEKNGL